MTRLLTIAPRDRRALLFLSSVLALVLVARVIPAYLRWTSSVVTSAQAASDRLSYAERVIAALPDIADSVAARERRLGLLNEQLLRGRSPAAIASELSAVVTGAARDAGLDVISASAMADSVTSVAYTQAVVQLDAQGDVSGVLQFLLLLELAPGLLDVLELSVGQGEPAAALNQTETLRLAVRVSGVSSGSSAPAGTRTVAR